MIAWEEDWLTTTSWLKTQPFLSFYPPPPPRRRCYILQTSCPSARIFLLINIFLVRMKHEPPILPSRELLYITCPAKRDFPEKHLYSSSCLLGRDFFHRSQEGKRRTNHESLRMNVPQESRCVGLERGYTDQILFLSDGIGFSGVSMDSHYFWQSIQTKPTCARASFVHQLRAWVSWHPIMNIYTPWN